MSRSVKKPTKRKSRLWMRDAKSFSSPALGDWQAFQAFLDDVAPRLLSDEHRALVGKLQELK